MQKTYNAINENRLRLKESLAKSVEKTRPVIDIVSTVQEWFKELGVINDEIIDTLQNELAPLLDESYDDEEEADEEIAQAFLLFGIKCDELIMFYDEVRGYYAEEFSTKQEIVDAFISICTVMLKELLLLHINIEDALKNSPEDATIEYNPDIQTQIEFIQ